MLINNIQIGQIINVQAFKHDGTLYRQWNGVKVISVSRDEITLFMYKTKVREIGNDKWIIREPTIWYFSLKYFYNTLALIRKDETFFYTNMASTPHFENNTLMFIDYDLDIKAYPQKKIKIVDEHEFKINKELFEYGDKLIAIIEETKNHVMNLLQEKKGIFDPIFINNFIEKLVNNKQLPESIYIARKTSIKSNN